ncbi:MAG: Cation transport protein chaC [Myxococcaceae bacterium]|nr:Cation transport protein chaC [Myxococcaceae bacterium]
MDGAVGDTNDSRELHVFGYGSLLFRPDFPYAARSGAYVRGWQRRLDQGSPDHRGTPERLGRVATLVRAPDARCGGAVYTIESAHRDEVLAMLDHRERGGYARIEVEAFLVGPEAAPGAMVLATTWIATTENPYYLGPAPLDAMVAQIRAAVGPSGANIDYVRKLAAALADLGVEDPDVARIADALATEKK